MPRKVIFDFDSVTFMDSAGIGLIIGRYKFVNMLGGKLEVANLTESVKKIFEMSGILRLIPVANLDETFFNKAIHRFIGKTNKNLNILYKEIKDERTI